MNSINYFDSDGRILEVIGLCLKNMRLNCHLSQRELAERAGIARTTISAAENGKSITTLDLIKILRQLRKLEMLKSFESYNIITPVAMAKFIKRMPQRIRNVKSIKDE